MPVAPDRHPVDGDPIGVPAGIVVPVPLHAVIRLEIGVAGAVSGSRAAGVSCVAPVPTLASTPHIARPVRKFSAWVSTPELWALKLDLLFGLNFGHRVQLGFVRDQNGNQ
jgi:hypothetical protein